MNFAYTEYESLIYAVIYVCLCIRMCLYAYDHMYEIDTENSSIWEKKEEEEEEWVVAKSQHKGLASTLACVVHPTVRRRRSRKGGATENTHESSQGNLQQARFQSYTYLIYCITWIIRAGHGVFHQGIFTDCYR